VRKTKINGTSNFNLSNEVRCHCKYYSFYFITLGYCTWLKKVWKQFKHNIYIHY